MCAMEINQAGVGKSDVRPASVPGELTIGEHTLQNLDLPREIQPQQVLTFLKQQYNRLVGIQSPLPVKTDAADIPPPGAAGAWTDDQIDIAPEEYQALNEVTEEFKRYYGEGGMGAQSADGEGSIFDSMGNVLDYLKGKYGDVPVDTDAGDEGGGLMDWYMATEIGREADEVDKKWGDTLHKLMTSQSASPEAAILAITEYVSEKYGTALRKAITTFSERTETHQQFVAELGLEEGRQLNATEMLQANMEQQTSMMDSNMAIAMIRDLKTHVDKAQQMGKSQLESYHSGAREVLRNVRTT